MTLRRLIVGQFARPEGTLGRLAGLVMAHRPSNRARNRWTLDLLALSSGDQVLEFGCGPGFAVAAAVARVSAGRVVGVDHSAVMIAQATARNRRAVADGRVELVLGGLDRLATYAGRFDKAWSVNVIQFLPDKTAALAALMATLRPGAVLAVTYMPRHRDATAADARRIGDELAQHMTAAGAADVRLEELPLAPVPAVAVIGHRALSS
jgi:trans-aconitate methyltransferase